MGMKGSRTTRWLCALAAVAALAACGPDQKQAIRNVGPSNAGPSAGRIVPPVRHAAMTPYTAFQVHPDIAAQIDKMRGLKWTVVLQEGNKVYVGSFPQHSGAPPAGAADRAEYRGVRSFDTPADLRRQTPDDWIRAMHETPPRYDSYDHRPKDRMGYLDPKSQDAIRKTVRRALPNVQSVLITTDVAAAAILRGYAGYVQAGGDMQQHMKEFHDYVALIWPNGKGVAPDRPSASPNFGPLGTPADDRTPVRGPVRQG
jgi:hypothetical protein